MGLITHLEDSCRTYVCASLSVVVKSRYWGGPGPVGLSSHEEGNVFYFGDLKLLSLTLALI